MQRTFKYALSSVIGALMIAPAFAQDNFPDVPDNHWAYEALARLKKDGILVGYPDGKYRGARPASRYELAVAIHAAYVNLKNITDGLQAQIDELKRTAGTGNGADIQALRDALTALQNDVATIKGYGADIAALRKLTDAFQKDLLTLGVDVEQMKKDLADLNDRVTRLERNKPAIDIHGDANLWVGGGVTTTRGEVGINMDGRVLGQNTTNGNTVTFPRDLTILHEAALSFVTTRETGPKAKGTLVFGNMLGGGAQGSVGSTNAGNPPFGNQSQLFGGVGYSEGQATFYVQELSVLLGGKLGGSPITAEIGRVGYKVNKYLFQRPDVTSYFENERYDNGKYILDGGIIGLNFGSVNLEIVGGLTSRRVTSGQEQPGRTNEIQPIFAGLYGANGSTYINYQLASGINPAGGFQVDRTLGLNLNTGFSGINVNASYLLFESDGGYSGITGAGIENNRIAAYGINLDTNLAGIKVSGGYNRTDLLQNNNRLNGRDNAAYFAKLGYEAGRFGITAGYREIEAKYVAPGDWGRLGILRNPVNIRGFQLDGFFKFGERVTLRAGGEFDRGKSNGYNFTNFDKDTRIDAFNVALDFALSPNTTILLGYDDTRFRNLANALPGTGDSQYRFYTVGVGYGLSDAAKLKVQYQMSSVDNDFVVAPFNAGIGARNRGGFITTSLSVKF